MRSLFILGGIFLIVLILATARGARSALWWGMPILLLLAPTYIHHAFNAHVGGELAVLIGIMIGGSIGPLSRLRWSWADSLVAVVCVTQYVSDISNGKLSTVPFLVVPFYSVIPYFLGRMFLRSWEDVGGALRPLMVCVAAVSLLVIFESLTGWSMFRFTFRLILRAGLNRAMGNHSHPIIMGLALLLMWPWTLEASRRARAGAGPKWWRFMPWLTMVAIFGTVSRGPMAASIIAFGIYLFFSRPSWRLPLSVLGCVLAVFFVVGFDQIKAFMYTISGESHVIEDQGVHYIVINDEEYAYTGTDHRWLLFKAYATPLSNAGVFGYGYGEAVGSYEALQISAGFWSIDNNLIVWILTYGYLGITLFYSLALLALAGLIKVAHDRGNPFTTLAAGMCGSLVAFQAALLSVSLMREYQPDWMFFAGTAVTVAQLGAHARAARDSWRGPSG